MKTNNLSQLLLNLILLSLFASCTSSSTEDNNNDPTPLTKQKIIIQGKIDSLPEDPYRFSLFSKFKNEEIEFDSLQFKIEFEKESPVLVGLVSHIYEVVPIFAMPGDSIYINLKLSDIKTPKFTGSSEKENVILSQLNSVFHLKKIEINSLFDLEEPEFLSKLDSIGEIGQEMKGNFENSYFNEYYDVFLKLMIGALLEHHPIFSKSHFVSEEINLSEDYHTRYKSLFEENPNWLNIYSYVNCLNRQVDKKAGVASVLTVKFHMIDSLYKNKEINDFCKFYEIRGRIRSYEFMKNLRLKPRVNPNPPKVSISQNSFDYISKLEEEISIYKTTNPPSELLSKIEETFNKAIE